MVKSKVTHLNLFAHNQLFVCWRDYWTTSERQRGYHYATHWNGLRPQPRSVQTSVEECSEATAGLNGEREREREQSPQKEREQSVTAFQPTNQDCCRLLYEQKSFSFFLLRLYSHPLLTLSSPLHFHSVLCCDFFGKRREKEKKKPFGPAVSTSLVPV